MVRFLVLYDTPVDPPAFERHYREVHVPLIRQLEGLRSCTLSRNVRSIRGGDPCYLIAALDWDDMESLQAAFRSPQGQATAADVANLAPEGGVRSMVFELEVV